MTRPADIPMSDQIAPPRSTSHSRYSIAALSLLDLVKVQASSSQTISTAITIETAQVYATLELAAQQARVADMLTNIHTTMRRNA